MSWNGARRSVSMDKITRAVRGLSLPRADLVVGIGSGGIVPASLIAFNFKLPLTVMWLNYRDPQNRPRYADPRLVREWMPPKNAGTILLVDDVSVTGKTLAAAKSLLSSHTIITIVMKGMADHVLLPDITTCVHWPWSTPIEDLDYAA